MSPELTELKTRMSGLSNEELFKISVVNSADYRQEAIYFATEELTRRGIPLSSGVESISYPLIEPADDNSLYEPVYKGVRGWLLFLCLSLTIITPLYTLNQIPAIQAAFTTLTPYFNQFPGLRNALILEMCLCFIVLGFCVYAGVALWRIKKNAVKIAKIYLVVSFAFSIIDILLIFMAGLPSAVTKFIVEEMMVGIILRGIACAIWYTYLSNSKRVKATYRDE